MKKDETSLLRRTGACFALCALALGALPSRADVRTVTIGEGDKAYAKLGLLK